MKKQLQVIQSLALAVSFSAIEAAAEEGLQCKDQAEQILARLQTEVVGELSTAERASANQIVLDVCQIREQQVEEQVQQAAEQARNDEQAKSNEWFTESADKPGNKRLKRKSH